MDLREKPPIVVLDGVHGRGRDLEGIQLAQREADIKYFQPKMKELEERRKIMKRLTSISEPYETDHQAATRQWLEVCLVPLLLPEGVL